MGKLSRSLENPGIIYLKLVLYIFKIYFLGASTKFKQLDRKVDLVKISKSQLINLSIASLYLHVLKIKHPLEILKFVNLIYHPVLFFAIKTKYAILAGNHNSLALIDTEDRYINEKMKNPKKVKKLKTHKKTPFYVNRLFKKNRFIHKNFHPFDEKYITLDGKIDKPIIPKLKDDHFVTQNLTKAKLEVKKTLRLMALNIPKFQFEKSLYDPLKILTINFQNIDIFCLSELYIKDLPEIPNGYKAIFSELGNIKTTMILYKSILSEKIETLSCFGNITGISIKTGPKLTDKYNIYSIYRSPSQNTVTQKKTKFFEDLGYHGQTQKIEYDKDLLKYFESLDNDQKTIICGDLNWATLRKFSKNRINEKLYQNFYKNSNFINSLRNEITFFPDKSNIKTGTSIDIILHSKTVDIKNIVNHRSDVNFISDHIGHSFSIPYSFYREKREAVFTRQKITSKENEELENIIDYLDHNFQELNVTKLMTENSYESNGLLCRTITEIFSSAILSCNKLRKRLKKSGVKNCQDSEKFIQLKKQMNRKFLELKSHNKRANDDPEYKLIKRKMEIERRRNIRAHWKSKLSESSVKNKLNWALLDKFKNTQNEISKSITANDFAKRFHELSYDYTPIENSGFEDVIVGSKSNFEFSYPIVYGGGTNITDLKLILNESNNSEDSSSWDGVNLRILKLLPDRFWKIICYVISAVLKTGQYLSNFREIKSFPVFKKGNKNDVKNYRPINVAPTFANLVEKVMCRQMSDFWNKQGLLHDYQFGFRKGHNVGQLVNTVRKHIFENQKKYHCLILTDLSNAFGSCDMHLILKRMAPYCSENALRLLRSFLIQPTIKCKNGNQTSKPYHFANRGYSQGSNLSPFLFTCLMRLSHDLPKDIYSFSYADDDQLVVSSNDISELKNLSKLAIETFHTFCKDHNIKLNTSKTFFTLSGKFTEKEKKDFTLTSFGSKIDQRNHMNMLGINMDSKLNFQPHFEEIRQRTVKYCNLIYNFGHYSGRDMIKNSINSFIGGKFNHGIAYMPELNSKIYQPIQTLVNRLVHNKLTTKEEREKRKYGILPQYTLMKRCNFLSFQNLQRLNQMLRLNKILSTMYPIWEFKDILNSFINNKRISAKFYNLRNGPKMSKIGSSNTAPNIWVNEFNSLPKFLRNKIGTNRFENLIKGYYKSRCHHNEQIERKCDNCHQNTNNYKQKTLHHLPVKITLNNNQENPTFFEIKLQELSDKALTIDEFIRNLQN